MTVFSCFIVAFVHSNPPCINSDVITSSISDETSVLSSAFESCFILLPSSLSNFLQTKSWSGLSAKVLESFKAVQDSLEVQCFNGVYFIVFWMGSLPSWSRRDQGAGSHSSISKRLFCFFLAFGAPVLNFFNLNLFFCRMCASPQRLFRVWASGSLGTSFHGSNYKLACSLFCFCWKY